MKYLKENSEEEYDQASEYGMGNKIYRIDITNIVDDLIKDHKYLENIDHEDIHNYTDYKIFPNIHNAIVDELEKRGHSKLG